MSELEPCPFCGEYPKFYGSTDGSGFEAIDCINDDCHVSPTTDYMNYEDALKAWNTRAAPKVKALEWERRGKLTHLFADIFGETYFDIVMGPDGYVKMSTLETGFTVFIIYETLEKAKAAAQSHYEKLILEALE
jgi:hypothetical protein